MKKFFTLRIILKTFLWYDLFVRTFHIQTFFAAPLDRHFALKPVFFCSDESDEKSALPDQSDETDQRPNSDENQEYFFVPAGELRPDVYFHRLG